MRCTDGQAHRQCLKDSILLDFRPTYRSASGAVLTRSFFPRVLESLCRDAPADDVVIIIPKLFFRLSFFASLLLSLPRSVAASVLVCPSLLHQRKH
jgi:hypothetical protein